MSLDNFITNENFFHPKTEKIFRQYQGFILPLVSLNQSTQLAFYYNFQNSYISTACNKTLVCFPACEYLFTYSNSNQFKSIKFNCYPKGKRIEENLDEILVSNTEQTFLTKIKQLNQNHLFK